MLGRFATMAGMAVMLRRVLVPQAAVKVELLPRRLLALTRPVIFVSQSKRTAGMVETEGRPRAVKPPLPMPGLLREAILFSPVQPRLLVEQPVGQAGRGQAAQAELPEAVEPEALL